MRKSIKRSTKKLSAVLLAFAMIGSLAACGSVEPFYATALPGLGMGSGGMMQPPTPTEEPGATDEPAPTDDPGVTETPEPGEDVKTSLYVSPNGSDSNDGSLDKPFASLPRAIEAARGTDETVVINLREGTYQAQAMGTIELTEADSNLVIRSFPGETAEITGGVRIPFEVFSQVVDWEVLARIERIKDEEKGDENKRGKKGMLSYSKYVNVLQADLGALGVGDYGVVYDKSSKMSASLIWENTLMDLACYPNDGFLIVDKEVQKGNTKNGTPAIFTVEGAEEHYESWLKAKDVWITGNTTDSYRSSTLAVELHEDGQIYVPSGDRVKKTSSIGGKGIKFMNLIEELDAEGEWYLDRDTGYLYIVAPKDFGTGDELVFSNYSNDFLHISGAKNITLQGIRFANTMAKAVSVESSEDVVVDACEFTDIGKQALNIVKSTGCGIRNSSIHDIGGQAIAIITCGDRTTLTPSNCFVTNNLIEMVCQVNQGDSCININNCVGVAVSHNEIHDVPVYGIVYAESNDTIIEYNNIYKVCYNGGDNAAISCGRNWSTRGNVVRYNYIHDCVGAEMAGVYLDDLHSSTEVYGNVFHKIQYAVRLSGGRDNRIENNIAVDCMFVLLSDSRGMNPDEWDVTESGYLYKMLTQVPYNEGVWAERYPELANIMEDEPGIPKRNVIRNNVRYASGEMRQGFIGTYNIDENVAMYGTVENNIVIDSPDSFANYALKDFTVLEGSEIKQKLPDFQNIPFKEIGRYEYTLEDDYGKDSGETGVKQALKPMMPVE